MLKFNKFWNILGELVHLDNVCVRASNDNITGEDDFDMLGVFWDEKLTSSVIYSNPDQLDPAYAPCSAPEQDGKCLECRLCWDKSVKVVAYKHTVLRC